ncbi:hypothetical protein ZWY2020_032140 [Hordeum vulgare]|nr:hypothetical protein ZWY2020_032140 [Hordeum vulgare]
MDGITRAMVHGGPAPRTMALRWAVLVRPPVTVDAISSHFTNLLFGGNSNLELLLLDMLLSVVLMAFFSGLSQPSRSPKLTDPLSGSAGRPEKQDTCSVVFIVVPLSKAM